MNKLAQTAALLAAVVAVSFALLQAGGRLLFWQLPRLEGAVNAALAERGIALQGLEGRWRGLNPGLSASRIAFPGGELTDVAFELDVGESIGRNRVVARRMTIADARVALRRADAGWRLDGAGDDSGLSGVAALFWHSDEVDVRGRVVARNGAARAEVLAEATAVNRDGRHRFTLRLEALPAAGEAAESRCADCALVMDGDLHRGGPGALRVAARGFAIGPALEALTGVVPPDGGMQAEMAVDGNWRRAADGDAEARLAVRVQGSRLPAAPATLTAAAEAWSAPGGYRGRSGYRGRVRELNLASGGDAFSLADAGFRFGGGPLGGWLGAWQEMFGELWVPTLAVGDLLAPVASMLGDDHAGGRWLAALRPRARIDDLALRVDAQGMAFACRGAGGALASYKGVPEVDGVAFVARGHHRALRMDLQASDFHLAFPNWFAVGRGPYVRGDGVLTVAFAPGYVGGRGTDLRLVHAGSRLDGAVALAHPDDRDEARVAADVRLDRVDADAARDYVPTTLDAGLRDWLLGAVGGGEIDGGRLVYHGHMRTRGDLPLRRMEMAADVSGVEVDYHARWPAASDVAARIEVTGRETRLRGSARAFDTDLADVRVSAPRGGGRVEVAFRGAAPAARLLDFARATPAIEGMPFLDDAWTAAGEVDFVADLDLPLAGGHLRTGDLRVDLGLAGVGVDMADLGLRFDDLRGDVAYAYPARLDSEGLDGALFGAPARIAVATDDDAVRFEVRGAADMADARRLLGVAGRDLFAGGADFAAAFNVYPGSSRAAELIVESELRGVRVDLPPPLGKAADERRPVVATMRFPATHSAFSVRYGNARGWLHIGDEGIRSGAVGIGAPLPAVDARDGSVVIAGGVDAVSSAAMRALLAPTDAELPFAWRLQGFRIGSLALGATQLTDVELDGSASADGVDIRVRSAEADGALARTGDEPWRVTLTELRLPTAADDGDPLDAAARDAMIAMDVVLARVLVGGEDFGSWSLKVRPTPEGVAFEDVVAEFKGLRIEASAPLLWTDQDETRFAGTVLASDVENVLPLWDFAPSVESETFESTASLRWPGSPLNFDLGRISGEASLALANGRFLNMEQGGGAARLMSLINYRTIIKRMRLDFSDVVGDGISFDAVRADLVVADGQARFARPAQIAGTGVHFLIAGDVHLGSGELDLDTIVTLPLHNSLPWYAAFLALANPATAVGVVVTRNLLKDQLEALTSGRYRVGGTYDDPEVEFVSIFGNDLPDAHDAHDLPDAHAAPDTEDATGEDGTE